MKIKKILAAVAACAMALSTMAVSVSALADNQKAYMFGGAQVTWDKDVDGDDDADVIGGANGSQWIGTIDSESGAGTINIPVSNGSLVEIVCDAWGELDSQPIFTATIDGTSYDCYFGQPVAYSVTEDISKLKVDIQWILTDGSDGSINDWCGAYVIVTEGGAAAPAADDAAPAADATTAPAATGNVPAAVMASVMAVAGAAVVASRKRK